MPKMRNHSTSENSEQEIFLKILGEPASKANSRRLVVHGGTSRFIKSQKALFYTDTFRTQASPIDPLLEGDLSVTMHVHYASRRPDLDESLILDLLQGIVYVNDRQVKEKHIYWHLDKECPRAEIWVKKKTPSHDGAKGEE